MGQPHKHAAVIKAWADGESIEVQVGEEWQKVARPLFLVDSVYRVKPKNITVKRLMSFDYRSQTTRTYAVGHGENGNIEFTFDPEGKLLDAKVLK